MAASRRPVPGLALTEGLISKLVSAGFFTTQFTTQLDKTGHNGLSGRRERERQKYRIYRHFRTRRNWTGDLVPNSKTGGWGFESLHSCQLSS